VGVTADAVDELRPVLAEALGVARLDELDAHPLSAGASRLTWVLDIRAAGVGHRLVLQRVRSARSSTLDIATQARLLRAAGRPGCRCRPFSPAATASW
jgi:hypothetical protein